MVSFYLRDKQRTTTTVQCSITPQGMKRICLAVPNCTISPKDWGEGTMKTGKGKIENGRIQDKLNDAQQAIDLQKNKMENDALLFIRQKNLLKDTIGTKVELEQKELAAENSKTLYQSALIKYNDLKNINY